MSFLSLEARNGQTQGGRAGSDAQGQVRDKAVFHLNINEPSLVGSNWPLQTGRRPRRTPKRPNLHSSRHQPSRIQPFALRKWLAAIYHHLLLYYSVSFLAFFRSYTCVIISIFLVVVRKLIMLVTSKMTRTSEMSYHPSSSTIIAGGIMSPDDDEQLFQFDCCDSTDKGKQRSLPVPIVVDSHDVFHGAALIGSPSSSSYRSFGSPSSSAAFSPTSFTFSSPDSYHRYAARNRSDESMDHQPPSGFSPKGKERATATPILPPLSFQPIELDPLRAMGTPTPAHDADDLQPSSSHLSRQRFQHASTHGLADLSVEDDSNLQFATPEDAVPIDPSAWYTLPRSPELNLPIHQLPNSTNGDFVLKSSVRALYRSKGRSKSSPFPLSALDFVPASDADVIQPLPLVISNYFDLALPKELRIRVLQALLHLHEDEHCRQVEEGRISFAKATSSRGRWVGRDKGIRELFKLTRVG